MFMNLRQAKNFKFYPENINHKRKKINKVNFLKLENMLTSPKDYTRKMNRQVTDSQKTAIMHISKKGLEYRIYRIYR